MDKTDILWYNTDMNKIIFTGKNPDGEHENKYMEIIFTAEDIHVDPSLRRQGLGKFLLYTAEMKLKEAGTDKSYCLPAEGAEEFFTACGYARGNEYSEELDTYVYEKTDLNNCSCK